MTGKLWYPTANDKATSAAKTGPVKWCKRCSRKHGTRQPRELVSAAVSASTGKLVQRMVRP